MMSNSNNENNYQQALEQVKLEYRLLLKATVQDITDNPENNKIASEHCQNLINLLNLLADKIKEEIK